MGLLPTYCTRVTEATRGYQFPMYSTIAYTVGSSTDRGTENSVVQVTRAMAVGSPGIGLYSCMFLF